MTFNEPKSIPAWETTDKRIHSNYENARRHQVSLDVGQLLETHAIDNQSSYFIVNALAAEFDFVKRTPA